MIHRSVLNVSTHSAGHQEKIHTSVPCIRHKRSQLGNIILSVSTTRKSYTYRKVPESQSNEKLKLIRISQINIPCKKARG